MNTVAQKTKRTNWFRYALGMLGYSIPGYLYTSHGTAFYNTEVGLRLDMIALGGIFFVLWDAVNDPLCGFLSDRTRTKYGRRKPWLLIGAPIFALTVNLFFNPPNSDGSQQMLLLYYTIMLMLTETANTVLTTNYHSLLPELFTSVKERTKANAARQILSMLGMIGGFVLPPMLVQQFGYRAVALMLSIIGFVVFVFSVLGVHENLDVQVTPQPKLLESLKAVAKNKNFWAVGITNFFYQGANGLILAVIPFFVLYTLGLEGASTTILTASVFVTAIPAIFGWSMLARKIGIIKTWRCALLVLAVSFVPMLFVSTLAAAIICGMLMGVGLGGVIANIDLISAAIIDEDAKQSGLRREGIYQSAINFIIKFSGLLRSLVFFLVTILYGFYDKVTPGSNPSMAARSMFSVFPLILIILAFAASLFVSPKIAQSSSEENSGKA